GLPVGDPAGYGSPPAAGAGSPAAGAGAPMLAGVVANQLTLAQLASALEQRATVVTGHLSEVDTSWSAVSGAAAALAARGEATAVLADGFGESQTARLLRDRLSEVDRLDLGDPLSAAPHGKLSAATASRLSKLETALAEATQRLADLTAWRDGY